ncbi:hypothetical protein N7495_005663 [Penicillium taxi]|uniref:uncharacterized protein n=1 Tax=Penicillium taxi TaxID=168475 RepID=UPI002545A70B|nr:uncharacterized protein N7495_005663 [Penicillium taxi]KAJ5893972.1 hypothetical protein N7495_005663 [Penicillium taxi]
MWKSPISTILNSEAIILQSSRCLSCQFHKTAATHLRPYTSSIRFYATGNSNKSSSNEAVTASSPSPKADNPSKRPVSFQRNPVASPNAKPGDADFVLPVLSRPIGAPDRPFAGQNTGVDSRTFRERRDDFVDYDKHIARRKELTRLVAKPYFREWSNLRFHEGKTFLSNPRLFKGDKALFFPNLHGITLASPKQAKDTTLVLEGKLSVVRLFCSEWAEEQTKSFTDADQNPGLAALLAKHKIAQRVDINLEEGTMRAWIVKRFMGGLRKKYPTEQHSRYFLVEKGFTESLKEAVGMMNKVVGYVYLVDADCRIRWAGSGPAKPEELESLNAGLEKLITEAQKL